MGDKLENDDQPVQPKTIWQEQPHANGEHMKGELFNQPQSD